MSSDSPDAALGALLARWPAGALRGLRPATSGTVNQTWLVDAERGPVVLRAYQNAGREQIAREHALIAYAAARGVPAIAPLPLAAGGTVAEQAGRFYALFPHAPGRQLAPGELSAAHSAMIGRALAELHAALRDYPLAQVGRRKLQPDRAGALATLAELLAAPAVLADPGAAQRLRAWQSVLMRGAGPAPADIGAWPWQATHGDFQATNLFFAAGGVCAIIDWDQHYAAPRAWEIARVLHVALDFAPELCRALLAGYRSAADLPAAELDALVEYYCWFRAHDLWLERAVYLEGNTRMRPFLRPGPEFVPLAARWEACRARI